VKQEHLYHEVHEGHEVGLEQNEFFKFVNFVVKRNLP